MIYHFWLPTRKLQGLLCTGTGPIWSKRYNKTGLKLYLDSILKSRDFTLSTKACLVIAMVFPVVMYGCESWTIKKAGTKELMLLNCGVGEDLRVPWTARRSNQSILEEISPGCSLEGLMLKLKLQYFGHLMRRVDSLEKTLMLGGTGGRRKRGNRGWDGWMASPTQWTWVWVNSGSWWWTGRTGLLQSKGSQRVGHDWVTELNWTEPLSWALFFCVCYIQVCGSWLRRKGHLSWFWQREDNWNSFYLPWTC